MVLSLMKYRNKRTTLRILLKVVLLDIKNEMCQLEEDLWVEYLAFSQNF
jgi:hypothetical protein